MAVNRHSDRCATRACFTLGLAALIASGTAIGEAAGPFGWKWGRDKEAEQEQKSEAPAPKPARKRTVKSTAESTTAPLAKKPAARVESRPESAKSLTEDQQRAMETLLRAEAAPTSVQQPIIPTKVAPLTPKPANPTVASYERANPPPPSRPKATAPLRKSVSSDSAVTKVSSRVPSPGSPAPKASAPKVRSTSKPVELGRKRLSAPVEHPVSTAEREHAAAPATETTASHPTPSPAVSDIEWASIAEPAQEPVVERIVAQPLPESNEITAEPALAAAADEQPAKRSAAKSFDGWTRVSDEPPAEFAPAAPAELAASTESEPTEIEPIAYSSSLSSESATATVQPLIAWESTSLEIASDDEQPSCTSACSGSETCANSMMDVAQPAETHPRRIAVYVAAGGLLLLGCGLALLRAATRRLA